MTGVGKRSSYGPSMRLLSGDFGLYPEGRDGGRYVECKDVMKYSERASEDSRCGDSGVRDPRVGGG